MCWSNIANPNYELECDVFGPVPKWISRWGVTVLFILLVSIILLGFLISFPQEISVPISVVCETNVLSTNTLSIIGFIDERLDTLMRIVPGQQVNVKLDLFPYLEYGIMRGFMTGQSQSIERNSANMTHNTLIVSFPDGLRCVNGRELPVFTEAEGVAEIVIGRIHLIDYLFNPFRSLLNE